MTYKKYTIAEKKEMCGKALHAQIKGISIFRSSKDMGVSDVSLYTWIKKYKAGKLIEKPEKNETDIPYGLVDCMSEALNGPESVSDEMNFEVYSPFKKGTIPITIERPKAENINDFDIKVMKSVLKRIRWRPVVKGFEFSNNE